jgi:hypothetical protein
VTDQYRVAFGRSVFTTVFATQQEASEYLDQSEALDLINGFRPKDGDQRTILRGVTPVEIRFAVNREWITAPVIEYDDLAEGKGL